jgi:phosphatidylserine/phosphatidylglycerophosphate/cardiolipin synthase-like enzyme
MLPTPSPTLHTASWARDLADDIAAATSSVTISALSMLPPHRAGSGPWPRLWQALIAAAARKLLVTIYLPMPQRAHPATRGNARAAAIAHHAGVRVILIPGPRLLHAKSAVIDARLTYIGSGNFTAAACGPNHEIYARFLDRRLAAETIAALARIESLA